MPISEFGETGRLVRLTEDGTMVVLWAVYGVENKLANQAGEVIATDGPFYKTSRGWMRGKKDESVYFAPKPRERSLKPCCLRAVEYARKNWPNLPAQTH